MTKVLVIDDDEDIRQILQYNLEKEGYKTIIASNGNQGIELAKQHRPDLIILDVMMPEMDGVEVCEKLRNIPNLSHVLICFLTARNEDYSQIAGLNAGADDYISKPIKPKVFLSKIKALLRRKNNDNTPLFDEEIRINRDKYVIEFKGESIHLPKKEFELMALLTSKSNYVFKRDVIMNTVWGQGVIVGDRTIDVHIRKLREKFGSEYIQTVKGVGYKFIPKEKE